jgi:tryptophanyl-tRNA synthetase
MKKRIFSGIQPTGRLHIGNYLGAIRHWVAAQDEFASLLCIADLHALTIPHDPATLRAKTYEVTALLLAAGIEPTRSTLFVQSHVSAHAELAWLLNCVIPVGWLQRMTQFKDKAGALKQQVSVGLFTYPALMAADILLYDTDYVPVGEDQTQHLELTRDVAQRFNTLYGETFKLPAPLIPQVGARIMGLDTPTKKMSKSETRPGHAISLLDTPEDIRAKLVRATTDSLGEIRFDPYRPGVSNLLVLYELFTGSQRSEIEARFAGRGYAELKHELTEVIIAALRPLQARYHQLAADPTYLTTLLTKSADRIRPLAEKTLARAQERMGLER